MQPGGRLALGRGSAQPEMRLRLRPIVEAKHRLDDPIQLLRELDGALSAAIGAARMLEALQLHAERGLQLCHGAGQQHSTARRVFLYDTEAVTRRKRLYGGNIRGLRTVLPREVLTRQVPHRAVAAGEPTDPVTQVLAPASSQQHADLHSLRRVRGSYRTRA